MSDEVCIGVCRSCSRYRMLWLPGRICEKCIKGALTMSEDQAALMLAALDEMEESEPDVV